MRKILLVFIFVFVAAIFALNVEAQDFCTTHDCTEVSNCGGDSSNNWAEGKCSWESCGIYGERKECWYYNQADYACGSSNPTEICPVCIENCPEGVTYPQPPEPVCDETCSNCNVGNCVDRRYVYSASCDECSGSCSSSDECRIDQCGSECTTGQNNCGAFAAGGCPTSCICEYRSADITNYGITTPCIDETEASKTFTVTGTSSFCGDITITTSWGESLQVPATERYGVWSFSQDIMMPQEIADQYIQDTGSAYVVIQGNREAIDEERDEKDYAQDCRQRLNIVVKHNNFFYCPAQADTFSNMDYYGFENEEYYTFNGEIVPQWEDCESIIEQNNCCDSSSDCVDATGTCRAPNSVRDVDSDEEYEVCYSLDNIQGGWIDPDAGQEFCDAVENTYSSKPTIWYDCDSMDCQAAATGTDDFDRVLSNGWCCGDDPSESPTTTQVVNDAGSVGEYQACCSSSDMCADDTGACVSSGTTRCLNVDSVAFKGTCSGGDWVIDTEDTSCESVCDKCNVNRQEESLNRIDLQDITTIRTAFDEGSTDPYFDTNGDGEVNDADVTYCSAYTGTECAATNCGNYVLEGSEQCEEGDPFLWTCPQTECSGTKTKQRIDTECTSCICVYTEPTCVAGQCGAECAVDADCSENEVCSDSCGCVYSPPPDPEEPAICEPPAEECDDGECRVDCNSDEPPVPKVCENPDWEVCADDKCRESCGEQCDVGESKCIDGTCSTNCQETDIGNAGCIGDSNGICEYGEGCACDDCTTEQDSCVEGAVCSTTQQCKCEEGTQLCDDGTCQAVCDQGCTDGTQLCSDGTCSTDCSDPAVCNGEPDGVCEEGEGCACSDCFWEQDSCVDGLRCGFEEVCDDIEECPVGTALCDDGTCSDDCESPAVCNGDPDGVCDPGEGCACSDCAEEQGSCVEGSVCGADELCGCPVGTQLCSDGTCSEECVSGPAECIDEPDGICEYGEGCACSDCQREQDSCISEAICGTDELCQTQQEYCTYVQEEWGQECENNNIGCLRDEYWDTFVGRLIVGRENTIVLEDSSDVENFLPQVADSQLLTQNYTNPNTTSAGTFGGQLTALKLNVLYTQADVGAFESGSIGDLYIDGGKFEGISVNEFLDLSEQVIGGQTAFLEATDASLGDMMDTIEAINENYQGCIEDDGFLAERGRVIQTPITSDNETSEPDEPVIEEPEPEVEEYLLDIRLDVVGSAEVLEKFELNLEFTNNLDVDIPYADVVVDMPSKLVTEGTIEIDNLAPHQSTRRSIDVYVMDYESPFAPITVSAMMPDGNIIEKEMDLEISHPYFTIKPDPMQVEEAFGEKACLDMYYVINTRVNSPVAIEMDITDPSSFFGQSVIVDYYSVEVSDRIVVEPMISNPYCIPTGKDYKVKGYIYQSGTFKLVDTVYTSSENLLLSR